MEYMKEKNRLLRHPHLLSALHETRLPQSHYLLEENRRTTDRRRSQNCGTSSALNTKRSKTDRCAYFRPADKLTYALGFIGMLDRMPYKLMQEAICKLMRRFGRRTYYRVRKGERPLSPDEQKSMLNILKQCGINDPGKFDAYFEAYDW